MRSLERPQQLRGPGDRDLPQGLDVDLALGLRRVLGRRDLDPVAAGVTSMQLRAEVAVVECGVRGAVARVGQDGRHRNAEMIGLHDVVPRRAPRQREQSLAGSHEHAIGHGHSLRWLATLRRHPDRELIGQPPDSAWTT
jgi:hypothetical protein